MFTELTFAILKYGFLILLWVFVWLTVRSLHRDIETLSPRKSRAHRRAEKRARKAATAPVSPALGTVGRPRTTQMPVIEQTNRQANTPISAHADGAPADGPTLLVVIDGPLAGSSVPLSNETITLGRSATNTVVMNDEFVSSHHARVYRDPASSDWVIEDLGSTNGTAVNQRRISEPTLLPAGAPVRIGATTFELR
ncbi:FHA domain-containing protein FhaB/FipA [Bifidobacterium sp.]|jgi:pSer/pThr/pTyr-binding forkhead associated (FHA) protein|uniref:FHA domain-containing protein FhaB/FipA n=1 Tax=Bifidobacterium sp. TaxID=41200 RepID=UPI0025C66AD8|nr:FHA domain-containing protein [Bifidobacterium sp.]MCH4209692.1 FHA domain-containing protein [Bifidobacterium sp.]MCI1224538.1 FHA domain-containing protein [Bifidobacterium sp.]